MNHRPEVKSTNCLTNYKKPEISSGRMVCSSKTDQSHTGASLAPR